MSVAGRAGVVAAALISAIVLPAIAHGGTYNTTVLNDGPSAYWRLGETEGSAAAADASGHSIALTYGSAAMLEGAAGIANDTDTSSSEDGTGWIASLTPATGVAPPGSVELWLRTTEPDSSATVFSYLDPPESQNYTVTVGTDGLLHADVHNSLLGTDLLIDGPSSVPVTDGYWHYVVIDFLAGFIYVDLTAGPQGTTTGGGISTVITAAATSSTIALGGSAFTGELDEVAMYENSLTAGQRSAHSAAGGLGWDALPGGGEEGGSANCPEYGVFHKGVPDTSGSNYSAYGALNYITTVRHSSVCGSAPPKTSPLRPTFITGQTVRVKLNGGASNYYVEWGPVQYYCDPTTTCWGVFFNFKADSDGSGPNDVCWFSFSANDPERGSYDNCPVPTAQVLQSVRACTPTGTHGWKLQHEGTNWVAYFLCNTSQDTATHDSSAWIRVFTHPDLANGSSWTSGWPDMEAFDHGIQCSVVVISRGTCWRREGSMTETHSNFQWLQTDGGNDWANINDTICRKDTSYRWDGHRVGTSLPLAWEIYENHNNLCGA